MNSITGRALATLACALLFITGAQAASAQTSTWRPGTSYFISEDDAQSFLEKQFDSALCSGIRRFGYREGTEYGDEYLVFDCDLTRNSLDCVGVRMKAVKGARPGYYRVVLMTTKYATCV